MDLFDHKNMFKDQLLWKFLVPSKHVQKSTSLEYNKKNYQVLKYMYYLLSEITKY